MFNSVPTIMIAWGLVMTLMCLVDSFRSLIVCVELTHVVEIILNHAMVELDCS